MVVLCDELLDELEYEKLSVDWIMAIERHPCITTEFYEILSIGAASLNQTKVDFVKEMSTAIQHNLDCELQQEKTFNAEGVLLRQLLTLLKIRKNSSLKKAIRAIFVKVAPA